MRPDGLRVDVVDAGSRLELENRTGETVQVLGYSDEPYLRIERDGVFENRRSPTLYANADRKGSAAVPASAKVPGGQGLVSFGFPT